MDTDQDITVGVNLQQVSIHGVKHKAPGGSTKEMFVEVNSTEFTELFNVVAVKMR